MVPAVDDYNSGVISGVIMKRRGDSREIQREAECGNKIMTSEYKLNPLNICTKLGKNSAINSACCSYIKTQL